MATKKVLFLLFTVLLNRQSFASYEAHEWGTFTSVVNSEGVTQNGMYHEDEVLPSFVHGFGELRKELSLTPVPIPGPKPPCHSKVCFDRMELRANVITQKMETPVIYFYSNTAQKVEVNVQFPEGIITETYPGPVATFPTMRDPHIIGNGKSKFLVNILNTKLGVLPFVEPENIYGHARNVASNLINSGAETEKFIFYRGLGRFQPKISITSKNGNLKIGDLAAARPQAAFLIHVNANGEGQLMNLEGVSTGSQILVNSEVINQLKNHNVVNSHILKSEQAREFLIDALVKSGLFKDEAVAMINTWEHGYLKVPGLRLLYILPRSEADEVLPLTMAPLPQKLVRTFVARMEILLDTDEQNILNEIMLKQNRFRGETLGRFAEPILNSVKALVIKTQSTNLVLLNTIDQLINNISDVPATTVIK